MVPKGLKENLEYRGKLIRLAKANAANAEALRRMCAEDLLFYVNAFVWTYDPRLVDEGQDPVVPFISYPYQDEDFLAIDGAIGKHDLAILKSRDMGASWMTLTTFDWHCQFKNMRSFMMVSRVEELVDNGEADEDSLFAKIDFIHEHLPSFLRPDIARTRLKILYSRTGSQIVGRSTTGHAGRGGRRTAIFLDEHNAFEESQGWAVLKATRDNTRSRIVNGTPDGTGNAFHSLFDGDRAWKHSLRMHWSLHPVKKAGLYRPVNGRAEILDKQWHAIHPGYKFRLEPGYYMGLRSPWYDEECDRAAHPREIPTELDMSFESAEYKFFPDDKLEEHRKTYAKGHPPMRRGDVDLDQEENTVSSWIDQPNGPMCLWIHPNVDGSIPVGRQYSVGCDISAGTGASSSTLCVVDNATGEQVAEYANACIAPERFGPYAVAVCRWFNGAFLVWEANAGPGRQFGDAVVETGYRNFYYRTNEKSLSRKQTDSPGWYSTKENKNSLLSAYRKRLFALDHKDTRCFVCRSEACLSEHREYKHFPNGSIEHSHAINPLDETSGSDNHGDRVIAAALAVVFGMMRSGKREPEKPKVPLGSFAERRKWEGHKRPAMAY